MKDPLNQKIQLLWVDDEQMILNLGQTAVERWGHDIQTAENGMEAVKIIEENTFDLIITDINMPRMDGFELLKHLREELKNQVPVLIITGAEIDTDAMGSKYSDTYFLEKPIKLETLKTMIATIAKRDHGI